jgi:hypothetical protein
MNFFGSYGFGALAALGKQTRQMALLFYLAVFCARLSYFMAPPRKGGYYYCDILDFVHLLFKPLAYKRALESIFQFAG